MLGCLFHNLVSSGYKTIMFKYFWLIIFCGCLLTLCLFDLQSRAAPGQLYDNPISNKAALEWEGDYRVGSEYFEAKKYWKAESALSSALVHAYDAQRVDELCIEPCDPSQAAIRYAREERRKPYEATIRRLEGILIQADKMHNETLEKETRKKLDRLKAYTELPDSRIDKTKQLLMECYKQHAASLRKIMAPIEFIPKELLSGLSIACGIIALFSIFFGRYLPLYLLNVSLDRESRLLTIFWTVSLVIVFGLAYYVLSRASGNLSDIERLEKCAAELTSK